MAAHPLTTVIRLTEYTPIHKSQKYHNLWQYYQSNLGIDDNFHAPHQFDLQMHVIFYNGDHTFKIVYQFSKWVLGWNDFC